MVCNIYICHNLMQPTQKAFITLLVFLPPEWLPAEHSHLGGRGGWKKKLSCSSTHSKREGKKLTLILPFLPFSSSQLCRPPPIASSFTKAQKRAHRATKIEKPLVFQPISCLKRLPTSALHKRAPLMCSLTFVWHAHNRKIPPHPPNHPPRGPQQLRRLWVWRGRTRRAVPLLSVSAGVRRGQTSARGQTSFAHTHTQRRHTLLNDSQWDFRAAQLWFPLKSLNPTHQSQKFLLTSAIHQREPAAAFRISFFFLFKGVFFFPCIEKSERVRHQLLRICVTAPVKRDVYRWG